MEVWSSAWSGYILSEPIETAYKHKNIFASLKFNIIETLLLYFDLSHNEYFHLDLTSILYISSIPIDNSNITIVIITSTKSIEQQAGGNHYASARIEHGNITTACLDGGLSTQSVSRPSVQIWKRFIPWPELIGISCSRSLQTTLDAKSIRLESKVFGIPHQVFILELSLEVIHCRHFFILQEESIASSHFSCGVCPYFPCAFRL